MVVTPLRKSSVAFATTVPSAFLSWATNLSTPGGGAAVVLVDVVEELDLAVGDSPDAHALSMAVGSISAAAVTVNGFIMGATYP
jgi:hypothetical protein